MLSCVVVELWSFGVLELYHYVVMGLLSGGVVALLNC